MAGSAYESWSDEEVATLGRLRADGLTWGQIAVRMGGARTPNACSKAWYRHFVDPPAGRPYHRWTPDDDIRAMEMLGGGASYAEVAEEFGTSYSAVAVRNSTMWNCYAHAPRHWDTSRTGEPWTVSEDRRLREMVADGRSWTECAVELRRTRSSVSGHGFKVGLRITGRTKRTRRGESGDRLPQS